MKEPKERTWCIAWAFAIVFGLAATAAPSVAQEPIVEFFPAGVCGDNNSPLGVDCSVKELKDSVDAQGKPNGAVLIRDVPVDPPVTLIFQGFETSNLIANGTPATDYDRIRVDVVHEASSAPGIRFVDVAINDWAFFGGEFNLGPILKRETIEFRVRAVDPTAVDPFAAQPVARIKDAELDQFEDPVFSFSSADPTEEARVGITEEVTSVGGKAGDLAKLKTFESHRAPGPNDPPDGVRTQELNDAAEFTPQSEVEVKKQINLEPGSDAGSSALLRAVAQRFSLTTDDEVGFVPENLEREDGSVQQVGVGRLGLGQFVPFTAFLMAQSAGVTRFITASQDGEHPYILHRHVGLIGAATALYLSAIFGPLDPLSNLVLLGDFETGSLLMSKLTYGPNPGDPLSNIEFFYIDGDTGDVGRITGLGDPITVRGADYTIDGLFGGQVTASGRAYLNVDLLPVVGGTFPIGAVLVFDTRQLFTGGGAPLVDSWFPGDTVQTAGGPVQLGGLVEVFDADDLTDNLVIRSVQFSLGSPTTIYAAKGGTKTDVRRVAGSGDPVPGTGDEIFLIQSSKVNQFGDVGLNIFTAAAGTFNFTGTAALLSRETAGTQFLLKKGDPLPGDSGLIVNGVSQIMVGDGRKAAVVTTFLDSQNQSFTTLIPFDYGDTGPITPGSPLITTGDILRDAGGLEGEVSFIQVEPGGLGTSLAAVFALLTDGTRAVLRIPVSRPKNDLAMDFEDANGLWARFNDSFWARLNSQSPEIMTAGDMDNSGEDELIVDFGPGSGLWVWRSNPGWEPLHGATADDLETGDLDGSGEDDVIVDFGAPDGLWARFNDSTWAKLNSQSPNEIATGDLDDNGLDEAIASFGPGVGLWVWRNNSAWEKLNNQSAEDLETADLDVDGRDEVIVDFGPGAGLWVLNNNSTWTKLNSRSPLVMTVADMDGDGVDEVIANFGPGIGLWVWRNNST